MKNKMKQKRKFIFLFNFVFVFVCIFSFHFRFYFSFCFHFPFCFCSCFRLCFCFIFYFLVLNFTMALLGHHTPVLRSFKNTYFEQQLWTAASENQHLSDKFRSSRPEVFCKKAVLRNFAKFKGERLCQGLFLKKVAGLRLWYRCFLVNFVKFLRAPLFIEHLWWLLLQI